jgi:uncharacterized GH25 family protein
MVPRAVFLVACLLPAAALAHVLYLMPERFVAEPGAVVQIRFENGDDFPEGTTPVRVERLRSLRLISASGEAALENVVAGERRTTARVRLPGAGTAIVTAETLPNFIELAPEKFRAYLEHEHLTAVLAWRERAGEAAKPGRELYSKFVKALIHGGRPDGTYRREVGFIVEFVPEADPFALRPGDELPVRLLFRGAPAADVAVQSAWLEEGKGRVELAGRTDAQGRLRVPIRAGGPHRLHAIVMERSGQPQKADWESFWASLTFEIPAGR